MGTLGIGMNGALRRKGLSPVLTLAHLQDSQTQAECIWELVGGSLLWNLLQAPGAQLHFWWSFAHLARVWEPVTRMDTAWEMGPRSPVC